MRADTERITNWLLSGLTLKSTVFHVGQYCGRWQASTSGYHRSSFHVILHGECWLHLAAVGGRAVRSWHLVAGDAAFLLRDTPHCLSADPRPPPAGRETERMGTMMPLPAFASAAPAAASPAASPAAASPPGVGSMGVESTAATGIACGFFEFHSGLNELLLSLMPGYIVARHDNPALAGARAVFDLICAEALREGTAPSPLIARLTDLLFTYALRAADGNEEMAPCFWALLCEQQFAPLVSAIIEAPGASWTTGAMAAFVHMSRPRFCRQFVEVAGQPPAQFVTLVRMKMAAALLRGGARTPEAAERVGYQSESAFAQAFKRVTGVQPGAYRRSQLLSGQPDHAAATIEVERAIRH